METSFLKKKNSNSLVSAGETFFWIEREMLFILFRKSVSDVFQTFALINKQVANQPIEIHFSKGDQKGKKKKLKNLGSSFLLFLQTPPQSHCTKQIPPEMAVFL